MMKMSIKEVITLCAGIFMLWSCEEVPSQATPTQSVAQDTPAPIYQEKAAKLLVKDESVRDFFEINELGISLYASQADKASGKVETRLYWDELEAFSSLAHNLHPDSLVRLYTRKGLKTFEEMEIPIPKVQSEFWPLDTSHSLSGLKIAIDPGHIGGDMEYAKKERKYIHMKADGSRGSREHQFNEGNLALATAYELKQLLEANGAIVEMTRTAQGKSAFGTSYAEWLATDADSAIQYFIHKYELNEEDSLFWVEKAEEKQIHRTIFKLLEFEKRADIINSFRPHATVIIHYNVDEKNEPDKYSRKHSPTDKNFNMAFVPGSYMDGELDFLPWRVEFLVKLVTKDIEHSIDFSRLVVEQFEEKTGVPAIEWDDSLRYLRAASMKTPAKGVFARNLAMNRQVVGTLCFGESLYQDNRDESTRLAQMDYEIAGIKTSSRVRDVAKAYYDAIEAYFLGRMSSK